MCGSLAAHAAEAELQTNFSIKLFTYLLISLKLFNELCPCGLPHSCGGASPYISKRLIGRLVHRIVSTLKTPRLSVLPKSNSKKEVFQPHLPVRLPCYDLAPVTGFALGRSLRSRTSGTPSFHGLTGGVYKARERIHRAMADARLLANPTSWSRVADSSPNWDRLSRSASGHPVASLCTCHCNTCVAPDVRAVLI